MGKPAIADEFAQVQYEPAECQAEPAEP